MLKCIFVSFYSNSMCLFDKILNATSRDSWRPAPAHLPQVVVLRSCCSTAQRWRSSGGLKARLPLWRAGFKIQLGRGWRYVSLSRFLCVSVQQKLKTQKWLLKHKTNKQTKSSNQTKTKNQTTNQNKTCVAWFVAIAKFAVNFRRGPDFISISEFYFIFFKQTKHNLKIFRWKNYTFVLNWFVCGLLCKASLSTEKSVLETQFIMIITAFVFQMYFHLLLASLKQICWTCWSRVKAYRWTSAFIPKGGATEKLLEGKQEKWNHISAQTQL